MAKREGIKVAIWPFRRNPAEEAGRRLLDAVTRVSRQPGFFGEGRVPDTLEGRTEMLFLHGILALLRLTQEESAAPVAQAFTDRLFSSLDAGLREAGVGDLSVPKRMHRLAGAFYGRLKAYAQGLAAGDEGALAAALARNILATTPESAPFSLVLARYALETAAALDAAPLDGLHRFEAWRPAPA